MSAPFRFKRFEIRQENAPMKVGTDGVLLGAWADGGARILDVGTGTGLIALMMAERFEEASIVGIDLNEEAVKDATENAARSVFRNRIKIAKCSLREFSETGFDSIVCNPPYFVRSLKSPDEGRNDARHTDTLNIETLVGISYGLLRASGRLSVVLPYQQEGEFAQRAATAGFTMSRIMRVRPTEGADFKRVMMEVRKMWSGAVTEDEMFIERDRHVYSDEYTELTKEFYLDKSH